MGVSRRAAACARESSDGEGTRTWCGTGWTGQPAVFERDGRTWVVFGAYDRAIHFVDAETGQDILPPFPTGDIIKGSVTIDPDGFPLVYSGSRDNYFRAIAFDRPQPDRAVDAVGRRGVAHDVERRLGRLARWCIDDYLFEGGENSQFHIVKLNRSLRRRRHGARSHPQLVFNAPGLGRPAAGRPRRPATSRSRTRSPSRATPSTSPTPAAWCRAGTSRPEAEGRTPTRTFRFWTGDDTDATVVVDDAGDALRRPRSASGATTRPTEVGQIMKLDPPQARTTRWCGRSPTRARTPPASGRRRRCYRDLVYRRHQRRGGCSASTARTGAGALGAATCPARPGSRRWSSTTCCSRATATACCTPTTCPTPRVAAARAVAGRARRLHRVDARGVAGSDLLRDPFRPAPRHQRAAPPGSGWGGRRPVASSP